MELGLTPAVMSILRKPTGACKYFSTDVVSITKKDLQPGEILDGEGGFCAHGEFFTAEESLKLGAVPMGLSGSMGTLYQRTERHRINAGKKIGNRR